MDALCGGVRGWRRWFQLARGKSEKYNGEVIRQDTVQLQLTLGMLLLQKILFLLF